MYINIYYGINLNFPSNNVLLSLNNNKNHEHHGAYVVIICFLNHVKRFAFDAFPVRSGPVEVTQSLTLCPFRHFKLLCFSKDADPFAMIKICRNHRKPLAISELSVFKLINFPFFSVDILVFSNNDVVIFGV